MTTTSLPVDANNAGTGLVNAPLLQVPVLPLRHTVAFPNTVLPLSIGLPRSVKLVKEASQKNRPLGLVAMKNGEVEEPGADEVYQVGTLGLVQRIFPTPEQSLQVIVKTLDRCKVRDWTARDPYLQASIAFHPEIQESGLEIQAMQKALCNLVREMIPLVPYFSEGQSPGGPPGRIEDGAPSGQESSRSQGTA